MPQHDASIAPHLCGLVLAGGRSSRMGRPKEQLVLPDGRTMLRAAVDALRRLTPVVFVISGTSPSEDLGCDWICDRAGLGPLKGIWTAVEQQLAEVYLVTACDMPLVDSAMLLRLVGAGRTACFEGGDGRVYQPLPARINAADANVMQTVLSEDAEASIIAFLERARACTLPVSAAEHAKLRNINTPEEYRGLWPASP